MEERSQTWSEGLRSVAKESRGALGFLGVAKILRIDAMRQGRKWEEVVENRAIAATYKAEAAVEARRRNATILF